MDDTTFLRAPALKRALLSIVAVAGLSIGSCSVTDRCREPDTATLALLLQVAAQATNLVR